jgi:hypothetical protein
MGKRIIVPAVTAWEYTQQFEELPQFVVDINIQPNEVKFKFQMSHPLNHEIYSDFVITLENFKQILKLKSNTLLTISDRSPKDGSNIRPNQFINLSALTYDQRLFNPYSSKNIRHGKDLYPICIFVKNPNGNFEDHDIILPGNSLGNITVNSNVEFTNYEGNLNSQDFLDTITVEKDTQFTDDNYYKYNITTQTYVDQVQVETVTGISNKSKVTLTNGSGSIKVLKSSVDSTDKTNLKVGFSYYPGLVNFIDA